MKVKLDPVTGLYCREDGAILMPPVKHSRFKTFRWTFGSRQLIGYRAIKFQGKNYRVHQMVCRAFNGLAPEDKPLVDHINRIRDDNRPENLHWVDHKENSANQDRVDKSIKKYGVRQCDDCTAYCKAHREAHREEYNARQRAYREAHREEYNARSRARYKAHRAAFDGYEEEYAKAFIKP